MLERLFRTTQTRRLRIRVTFMMGSLKHNTCPHKSTCKDHVAHVHWISRFTRHSRLPWPMSLVTMLFAVAIGWFCVQYVVFCTRSSGQDAHSILTFIARSTFAIAVFASSPGLVAWVFCCGVGGASLERRGISGKPLYLGYCRGIDIAHPSWPRNGDNCAAC